MTQVEIFLFGSALLLILCVVASKATGRLGIPSLVVFLGVGILAGSEGLGGIYFDNARFAQSLGILSLAYILFSGGLDTKWTDIRPVLKSGVSLATLGVLLTCLFMGAFIHYVLGFGLLESFLIGAIVSSTDAGAVFTVLRAKSIHLKGDLKPLLELESGSNDPMAVFLTTTILSFMQTDDASVASLVPLLVQQMAIGGAIGYFMGKGMVQIFNRLKLEFEGLYTVLSVASVIFIYTTTQALKGNGFLAVYIAGVVLGNDSFVFKKSLMLLHDGISWLMQCAMFLTLGLLIFPSQILNVGWTGILVAGFMVLVARPISVFLSLAFAKMNFSEKSLIAWVGLRGSVPVVMATYPLVAGIERADTIFNLVFFIALTSLLIQGTSIPFVARLLKVYDPNPDKPEERVEYTTTSSVKDMVNFVVPEDSAAANKFIVDLKLPKDLLIVLIERKGEVLIPRGGTTLEPNDKIFVLANDQSLSDLRQKLFSIS